MIKRMVVPVTFALLVGSLLGFFLFRQYDKEEIAKVGNIGESKEVYFLQVGVYSSKESMEANTKKLPNYFYQELEYKYYVYVGTSLNEQNVNKLKEFFIANGYNIYVKKFNIANTTFLTVLEQYDIMLEQAPDTSSYSAICGQVLAKYEELITDGREN